jgi:hypothetical protein
MPTSMIVKVSGVEHKEEVSNNTGNTLHYCYVKGYDHTAGKGCNKRFFSTKKNGDATKNAETADSLNPGDWIEMVLDDSSYQNVQTIKRSTQPADYTEGDAPQSSPSANPPAGGRASKPATANRGGGGGGSDKMSKAEWAAKDAKHEASINRSVALKASVDFLQGMDSVNVPEVLKLAVKFEAYLAGPKDKLTLVKASNGNTIQNPTPLTGSGSDAGDPGVQDDDIPF